MQTDREEKLKVVFRNFATAPKEDLLSDFFVSKHENKLKLGNNANNSMWRKLYEPQEAAI
jgi:hypothetical protein